MAKKCVMKWRQYLNYQQELLSLGAAMLAQQDDAELSEVDISIPNTMGGERWPPLK